MLKHTNFFEGIADNICDLLLEETAGIKKFPL